MTTPLPARGDLETSLVQEAEAAAAACLTRCARRAPLARLPLPIPVETWIELRCGYRVEYVENLRSCDGRKVDGLGYLGAGRMEIEAALVRLEPRLRYVLAHELGHLEQHCPDDFRVQRYVHHDDPMWLYKRSNPFERQADRFAVAFLMPPVLVARELLQTCTDHGLDQRSTVTELLRGAARATDLWRSVFVPEMAHRFRLSRAAVLFRLSGLRLSDGAPILLTRHAVQLLDLVA